MNAKLQTLQQWLAGRRGHGSALAAPILVMAILSMLVLPLRPWMLDTFFTLNIAVSLMVMMVASYMKRALDFVVFPVVLLLTTLLRLALNVASTRVVLMEGHTGTAAAGHVIEAFGTFLIGGNFAVGLIVFAILVVINFVVITKGAERIAEVGARFTLDAMPGKQMAIDADLNAGLINEKEAKRRRSEVGEEAEFFGSMDGASKYVRGDAMAGLLILFINIIGGFVIGVVQHDLSAAAAADSYILLAVGDALVAQIPALLISVASAMVVSRVGKDNDIGSQIARQVFDSPRSLAVVSGVIGLLGLIPGMPHLVFLLIAAALGGLAWQVQRRHLKAAEVPARGAAGEAGEGPLASAEASWDDLT
ncbi:MAG TPA: FHIPEP family type III secretion protein, partial [Macromonas sp.]|nr:FHIPEP family type III secretion protein [Macromonas sp.]